MIFKSNLFDFLRLEFDFYSDLMRRINGKFTVLMLGLGVHFVVEKRRTSYFECADCSVVSISKALITRKSHNTCRKVIYLYKYLLKNHINFDWIGQFRWWPYEGYGHWTSKLRIKVLCWGWSILLFLREAYGYNVTNLSHYGSNFKSSYQFCVFICWDLNDKSY